MAAVRVLIVEDQRMMRETMENYILHSEGYELAGSISCAADAESCCAVEKVDLILMDVCTERDESGFAAAEKIKKHYPDIKIIIVTSMLDATYPDRAREAGADSLWFKDVSREELMSVAERTVRGESVYPESAPVVAVGNAWSCDFTQSELRVLRLLVEGMTYKEMANELGISVDTVKTHIGNMLSKTGFTSKTKLAAVVISKKLIVNGF
ncbi:MAG: response regulator [Candidatus Avispirillum sp.]